jgi:putative acetyltransferase
MQIREDDLTDPRIRRFLTDHLDEMHSITPPGSVHALDLEGLRQPDIIFWSAWEAAELVGCGALKLLGSGNGEIKSMRIAPARRGKGMGSLILEHILDQARQRNLQRLFLETGAMPEFEPARALYRRYGFEFRGPFADYPDDPNSVFMTRSLRNIPGKGLPVDAPD